MWVEERTRMELKKGLTVICEWRRNTTWGTTYWKQWDRERERWDALEVLKKVVPNKRDHWNKVSIEGVALNSQPPSNWGSWNINLRRYRNREKAQRRQICSFKCGGIYGLWGGREREGMLVLFNQHLCIKQ